MKCPRRLSGQARGHPQALPFFRPAVLRLLRFSGFDLHFALLLSPVIPPG